MTAPGTMWLVGFRERKDGVGEDSLVLYTAGG